MSSKLVYITEDVVTTADPTQLQILINLGFKVILLAAKPLSSYASVLDYLEKRAVPEKVTPVLNPLIEITAGIIIQLFEMDENSTVVVVGGDSSKQELIETKIRAINPDIYISKFSALDKAVGFAKELIAC
jgi:hypothetical protein